MNRLPRSYQQLHKSPTVGDLRFSNMVAKRAYEHKDKGITFHPINFDRAVLLCDHDAGWANAPQNIDESTTRTTGSPTRRIRSVPSEKDPSRRSQGKRSGAILASPRSSAWPTRRSSMAGTPA